METLISILEALPPDTDKNKIQDTVKAWITDQGIGFGKIMQPLRLSLVGAMQGPDVFDIIHTLGIQETIHRLRAITK